MKIRYAAMKKLFEKVLFIFNQQVLKEEESKINNRELFKKWCR